MSMQPTKHILVLIGLTTGPACAPKSGAGADAAQVRDFELKRITTAGPDGAPVSYWASQVSERLVRDTMGNHGVDTCLRRVEEGSRGCMGRLTEHVQFRLMAVESTASWWLEFDVPKGVSPKHEWVFSTEGSDGSIQTTTEQL